MTLKIVAEKQCIIISKNTIGAQKCKADQKQQLSNYAYYKNVYTWLRSRVTVR